MFIFITTTLIEEPITKAWIEDPAFDISAGSPWYSLEEGDITDVGANLNNNQADFHVLGNQETVTLISNTPNNSLTSPDWNIFQNGDFMLPDLTRIDESGCYTYHYLDESTGPGQVHNFPSVHFRKDISMPVDMSDFIITNASLKVTFNASVNINVDTYNDWNQTANTAYIDWDKFLIGDSANFYVELSDTNYSYPFRVANFETRDVALGRGDLGDPLILNITDRELNYISDQDLITALNTVLQSDHQNFTISLGLDIYCEDNKGAGGGDQDEWNYLIFKSCNLTINYVKKIDLLTSVSWNQVGNKISGTNKLISQATLNFNYKISELWPSTAPFSEIKIYINDKIYNEKTIKLSSANQTFREVKIGGLDVTDYLDLDTNVSVSIQLFLADTFNLNRTITISIDDVYLYIEIIEIADDMTPILMGLMGSIVSLGVVFTLYLKIFQYPPIVRKIRKLKRKISKGKSIEPFSLNSRKALLEMDFRNKMDSLNLKNIDQEGIDQKLDDINNKNRKERE